MLRSVVNYANNSAGEMSVVTDDGRSIDLQSGSVRLARADSTEQVRATGGTESEQKKRAYEIIRRKRDVRRHVGCEM